MLLYFIFVTRFLNFNNLIIKFIITLCYGFISFLIIILLLIFFLILCLFFLAIFAFCDKINNIFFYICEMVIPLYYFNYINNFWVSVFQRIIILTNIISNIFFWYLSFGLNYKKFFFVVLKIHNNQSEFLNIFFYNVVVCYSEDYFYYKFLIYIIGSSA